MLIQLCRYSTFILVLGLCGACQNWAPTSSSFDQHSSEPQSKSIFVMTYNVENLFDIVDDPQKDDNTFLPLTLKKSKKHQALCAKIGHYKWRKQCFEFNWDARALKHKLENLAHVIALQNNHQGPDLLFLQEVENIDVLKQLNNALPKANRFAHISLIEGMDKRGIDVAIMSKLPMQSKAKLYPIPFKGISKSKKYDTRGILYSSYLLPNGESLSTYVVHFPAPYHSKKYRQQAFEYLNHLKKQHPHADYHLAAGDFNVTREESETTLVYEKIAQKEWLVPHLIEAKYKNQSNVGSNYYAKQKTWSFLDAILLSKNFSDQKKWDYDLNSFKIINDVFVMKNAQNQPQSFITATGQGASDHFPLQIRINLN